MALALAEVSGRSDLQFDRAVARRSLRGDLALDLHRGRRLPDVQEQEFPRRFAKALIRWRAVASETPANEDWLSETLERSIRLAVERFIAEVAGDQRFVNERLLLASRESRTPEGSRDAVSHDEAGGKQISDDLVQILSDVAYRDASYVTEARTPAGLSSIFLSEGLYVTRDVESDLTGHLGGAARKPLLVLGRAGLGKTSLLWRTKQVCEAAGFPALLVRAGSLLAKRGADQPSLADLIIEKLAAEPSRHVVLIDTIDLLLRSAQERDSIIGFILAVAARGNRIVCTCRANEARFLASIEPATIKMQEYSDRELMDALVSHVSRFYALEDRGACLLRATQIHEALIGTRSLHRLCRNPLTLRMLFEIHAPSEIHSELNVFSLYLKYWESRVEADRRAGDPISGEGSANLSGATERIALEMLIWGFPEAPVGRLAAILPQGGSSRDLQALISRAILHQADDGTASFFHQTFFEHAAARAIVGLGIPALDLLWGRFAESTDYFLMPILEQCLLVGLELGDVRVHEWCVQTTAELAKSTILEQQEIALYTYVHSLARRLPEDVVSELRPKLADRRSILGKKFVGLCMNMPPYRETEMFEGLGIVWSGAAWDVRQSVLEALVKLAASAPGPVLEFADARGLLPYLVSLDTKLPGVQLLAKILGAVARARATSPALAAKCLDYCAELYLEYFPRAKSKVLVTEILTVVAAVGSRYRIPEIAARLDAMARRRLPSHFGDRDFNLAWGVLWGLEWSQSSRSLASLIDELTSRREPPSAGTLNGLVEVAIEEGEDGLKEIWDAWIRLPPHQMGAWAPIVLERLFLEPRSWGSNGLRARFSDALTGRLGPAVQSHITHILSTMKIPRGFLTQLPFPDDSQAFLSEPHLQQILDKAATAGVESARQTLRELSQSREKEDAALQSLLADRVVDEDDLDEEMVRIVIGLCLASGNSGAIVRIVDRHPNHAAVILREDSAVGLLAGSSFNSRKGTERRDGARLLAELASAGSRSVPPMETVKTRLWGEQDIRVRGWCASILGAGAANGTYDRADVVSLLDEAALAEDRHLREQAFGALRTLFANGRSSWAEMERLVEIATTRPTDGLRIREALTVLCDQGIDDPDRVLRTLWQVLPAAGASLGSKAKHDLVFGLMPKVKRLVANASAKVALAHLRLAYQLDRILGKLAIEPVCAEAFEDLVQEIDRVAADPRVDEALRSLISRFRRSRAFSRLPGFWHDLARLARER